MALSVRWSVVRRSADVLCLEKTRLFGRALDALAAGTDLAALERQLALLAGSAVIRAWRDVRADATLTGMVELVREMRRELGERSVFDDDALADSSAPAARSRPPPSYGPPPARPETGFGTDWGSPRPMPARSGLARFAQAPGGKRSPLLPSARDGTG